MKCPACECPNPGPVCRRCRKVQAKYAEPTPVLHVKPIAELEREAIAQALQRFTRKDTARLLGVGRNWLAVRIERYGLKDVRAPRGAM